MLGSYVGRSGYAARGVPDGFLDTWACTYLNVTQSLQSTATCVCCLSSGLKPTMFSFRNFNILPETCNNPVWTFDEKLQRPGSLKFCGSVVATTWSDGIGMVRLILAGEQALFLPQPTLRPAEVGSEIHPYQHLERAFRNRSLPPIANLDAISPHCRQWNSKRTLRFCLIHVFGAS